MEQRSSILRWVLIAVAVWLAWTYLPKLWGGGSDATTVVQPIPAEVTVAPTDQRAPEQLCKIDGNRFTAELTTHSASLKHLALAGAHYAEKGVPIDLVTTPDHETKRPLRFDWRGPGVEPNDSAQVAKDVFDWKLDKASPSECVFSYTDDRVELRKIVRAEARPFELGVETTIKNLAPDKKKHSLSVVASAWRYAAEVESHLGRQSPFITSVECMHDTKMQRMTDGDFEPGDFGDAGYENGWFVQRGAINFAGVSNFYFSQALVALDPPAAACRLQVDKRHGAGLDGAFYQSRIAYDMKELGPNESVTYKMVAFLGPKERDVLASAAGGNSHLSDLVDLGYFSIIARYLLQYLVWLYAKFGNWGVAIILMTISVRLVLFPLTWKSIQSGFQMRRLKPEIDAISAKYKDDAQGKNVATMELWKKHKVNPLGGCLPALFQMPVWWALYTSLQTAVELYHTPFLYFPDLSAPDPYYIIPVVLGGTMILQQKLMPMQMDPMQQKMMTFVMPAVFTVMMLFMPAGLAVYMLTNSVLGIAQQVGIEKYWSRKMPPVASAITVRDKPKS